MTDGERIDMLEDLVAEANARIALQGSMLLSLTQALVATDQLVVGLLGADDEGAA